MYLRGWTTDDYGDPVYVEDDWGDAPAIDHSADSGGFDMNPPPLPTATLPLPSDTTPTSSINWTGLINNASSAFARYSSTRQAATARAALPPARPGYLPFPGTAGTPPSLAGAGGVLFPLGAGLAVFMLARSLMR